MRPLGAGILGRSARVPAVLREVMIAHLRAHRRAYEWGVHAVAFARPLGLGEEQLYSTVHGRPADACWDDEQACVMALADELHAASAVSEELWRRLHAHFDEAQLLELIVTAGYYHAIAYVCNAARVQAEDWAESFPPREAARLAPSGHLRRTSGSRPARPPPHGHGRGSGTARAGPPAADVDRAAGARGRRPRRAGAHAP
jgi:hypothetical protein